MYSFHREWFDIAFNSDILLSQIKSAVICDINLVRPIRLTE
jgi:hypothetical protein